MAVAATASSASSSGLRNRWVQLVVGIVCMTMIANLQYGWTLFVNPIDQKFHWGNASIQVAYTTFILLEKWVVPFEGFLVDKFGPRLCVAAGGILVGLAWYISGIVAGVEMLCLCRGVGGGG